jgi:hypothetical protein
MGRELNDGVVAVVNWLVGLCHAIALGVVLYLNALGFQFTQNWEAIPMVVSHILGTAAVIVAYALFMSLISIFISINRNLQRLVALQRRASETPRQKASKDPEKEDPEKEDPEKEGSLDLIINPLNPVTFVFLLVVIVIIACLLILS